MIPTQGFVLEKEGKKQYKNTKGDDFLHNLELKQTE